MKWNSFNSIQPITYETGNWDGKRSDVVICFLKNGEYQLCIVYEFERETLLCWVDILDFEVEEQIIMWAYIPDPFT